MVITFVRTTNLRIGFFFFFFFNWKIKTLTISLKPNFFKKSKNWNWWFSTKKKRENHPTLVQTLFIEASYFACLVIHGFIWCLSRFFGFTNEFNQWFILFYLHMNSLNAHLVGFTCGFCFNNFIIIIFSLQVYLCKYFLQHSSLE
jgi:hypothetical protein